MIVAHGHFNRCFIARWIGLPLSEGARPGNWAQGYSSFTGTKLNVEPGGVGHFKLT
jgi:probable phosphoglycerate mutase